MSRLSQSYIAVELCNSGRVNVTGLLSIGNVLIRMFHVLAGLKTACSYAATRYLGPGNGTPTGYRT